MKCGLCGIVHWAERAFAVAVQSFGVAMWRDLARSGYRWKTRLYGVIGGLHDVDPRNPRRAQARRVLRSNTFSCVWTRFRLLLPWSLNTCYSWPVRLFSMQSAARQREDATRERGILTLSCTMPSGGPVKLRDIETSSSKQDKVSSGGARGRHGNGGSTRVLFTCARRH